MIAIAAGRGPHTQLNDTFHRVMAVVLAAGLILLPDPPWTGCTGPRQTRLRAQRGVGHSRRFRGWRIEHRLFSAISMSWRGRPLTSHEVIVELIGATITQTGLRVRTELDCGRCPLGARVGDAELAAGPLVRHGVHREWNYTIQPAADKPPPTAR